MPAGPGTGYIAARPSRATSASSRRMAPATEGSTLSGFFYRQVLMLSSGSATIYCNGMLGFAINTRVSLVGELSGGRVSLREVGIDTDKNPATTAGASSIPRRPASRRLAGAEAPGWARAAPGATGPAGRQPVDDGHWARARKSARPDAVLPLAGVWEWQFRGADPTAICMSSAKSGTSARPAARSRATTSAC